MKRKICLHALSVKHQNLLLGLVRRLLPACLSKYKVKDKYLESGDFYKYREARFKPKFVPGVVISCTYGSMSVNDRIFPVADVVVDFENSMDGAKAFAKEFIAKLLSGKNQFVAVEPSLKNRAAMLRGSLNVEQLDYYDANRAASLIYTHVPWQIYEINRLWQDVLTNEEDKPVIRQLRVKIRRLRSLLALLTPLFKEEEINAWLKVWKAAFDSLAIVRELDVALLNCERIARRHEENRGVPILEKILTAKRQAAVQVYLNNVQLNVITHKNVDFLFWLYSTELTELGTASSLQDFLNLRFTKWTGKLLVLREKYPDATDMTSLHKIRIKIKRFRYALLSIPELKKSLELLRALKNLQDSLGFLHDDFVGEALLDNLLEEFPGNKELHLEVALFKGWDKGKAESTLENFPILWDNFCSLLRVWQKENL
ncbi:MAG: CHAD domain-containing protein [Phascolarctobacterium sp.]|nr:CHAD domain-containing protein [Phascolarctobacterium sp.]